MVVVLSGIFLTGCAGMFSPKLNQSLTQQDFSPPILAQYICEETNRARKKNNKKALPFRNVLFKGARLHSLRMKDLGFFEHENPHEGHFRTPNDRVTASGGFGANVAENIAYLSILNTENKNANVFVIDSEQALFSLSQGGEPIPHHTYETFAQRVVQEWLDSPGHRVNLLHDDAVELGCGVSFEHKKNQIPMIYAGQLFQMRRALE